MRYLLSLVEPLQGIGEFVRLLGNRSLSPGLAELARCEPTFTLKCDEAPLLLGIDPSTAIGAERVSSRRSELFKADLDQIADRHAFGRGDVLLINSLRHWSVLDVVDWLEGRPGDQRPRVILVLHYTPFPNPGVQDPAEAGYREAFRRIANSDAGDDLVLCTDSERLQAEYRSIFDIQVHLVPIPHSPPATRVPSRADGPLSIVFAGEARPSKGYHLLPGMVQRVLAQGPRRKVEFAFQSYGAGGDTLAALSALGHVRTIPEPLGEREYESLIADTDLMLIPYVDGSYRSQTSGVFCEAAALGIPAIVPGDTWMSDQLAASGAGVTFRAGDEEDLARACLEAIDRYDHLRDRAGMTAGDWRGFHNAETYCDTIISWLEA